MGLNADKKKDTKNELRKRIDNIEQQLHEEDSRIHKINAVQDSLIGLKEDMDRCAALLVKSLGEGEKVSFNNLVADNNVEFRKSCQNFEEKSEALRERVINLRNERDAAIQEYEDYVNDDKND